MTYYDSACAVASRAHCVTYCIPQCNALDLTLHSDEHIFTQNWICTGVPCCILHFFDKRCRSFMHFIMQTEIHILCRFHTAYIDTLIMYYFNSKQYIVHSLYCIQYSDTTVLHIMHHTILQCIVCSTVNHFYMKCLPRVAVCLYCSCVFVEGFRCCPKGPDGFRTSPPVVPVFPPCPRLGAGDLLPSMAFISGAAASRLYLPSSNAFVWCPARRINRVRSAAVKRRAERRSLRWTERVQNTPEPHQTSANHHHHHHHLLQCGCAGVQRLVCSSR